MSNMTVEPIPSAEARPWIMHKHYARRMPCVQYAFGLFDDDMLRGVVTYGTPSSSTLRVGVCGEGFTVLELNRLCIESDDKNAASMLVGRSLRNLPACAVVSYADTKQGHIGYVYQATNWLYTGLSAKRTDWHVEGMEGLHGQTIADQTRGMKNRAQSMRDMHGDAFSLVPRSRKHRYIYLCGDKRERRNMLAKLRYEVMPYPKGDTTRYDADADFAIQPLLITEATGLPAAAKRGRNCNGGLKDEQNSNRTEQRERTDRIDRRAHGQ